MTETTQIYVSLVGEGIDVWRPVEARRLPNGVYQIAVQPYDRSLEIWEFEPGEIVICQHVDTADGPIFAAISKSQSA